MFLKPDIWTACDQKICDYEWKIDFGRLYEFADGTPDGRAVLYGSRPPANDSLWAMAKKKGFEPVVFDRNVHNREKKIDTKISVDMTNDSWRRA